MRHKSVVGVLGAVGLALSIFSAAPARADVCLASGKPCGTQGLITSDRKCCPGMVCGWGNVCLRGCDIGGHFTQAGTRAPWDSCLVCDPSRNRFGWTNTGHAENIGPVDPSLPVEDFDTFLVAQDGAEEDAVQACTKVDEPSAAGVSLQE